MLILTRRIGELLKIGDDIEVAVLGIKGKQFRLGIAAPQATMVHREEVYQLARGQAVRQPPKPLA